MRRLFPLITLLAVFAIQKRVTHSYEIDFQDKKYEFGWEDVDGRIAYEQLLVANPKTGEIPRNIRKKELVFTEQLLEETAGFRNQALEMEAAGPFNVGGRTRAVELDIRDEDIILAGGVSGGVWKSIDGGLTWERKTDPDERNGVTCIVQDTRPGREDTWYYGTGEIIGNSASGGNAPFRGNGIYKSVDNGETWTSLPSTVDSDPNVFNSQFQYISNIEINDKNLAEDELIVAAFGGILRSTDGGDTWVSVIGVQLFDLDPSFNLNDFRVSFFTSVEKTSDGMFYAGLSTFSQTGSSFRPGIFASQDGENWFDITPFGNTFLYRRIVIGPSPSNPSRVFFMVDSSPSALIRYDLINFDPTTGPTGTFTNLSENIPAFGGELGDYDSQGSFNMVIRVHPDDPDLVFLGGTNLYRSTDGFTSSENTDWIGGYQPGGGATIYPNHHPDQHEVVFFPSAPNKLLSASDGGLNITNNLFADSIFWESRNDGYLTTQFFTIGLTKEEGDDTILGGMQDNGTDITPGTSNWEGLLGGDGGYVSATPGQSIWFASFQNGQTFRLTINDEFDLTSFARVDPEGFVKDANSAYLFINPFKVDPINSNRMFIAGGNYMYVNENISQIPGGSQVPSQLGWTRIDETFTDDGIISTIDISSDGSTVYAGSTTGLLFRVDNANNLLDRSAQELNTTALPDGYISSISINPEDASHILVTLSSYEIPSIFESTDGGTSFTDISGNLEENTDGSGAGPSVRWGEIVPTNSGIMYLVGTSTGLYSTENTSGTTTTWTKEAQDQIGSAVVSMMDYRPVDGKLVVATHGNGVFTTTIQDFKRIEQPRPGSNFNLIANYPNPFQTSTSIQYAIPEDGTVKIDLYSAKGEFINNLLWAPQFAGENSISWDGTNASGTEVANGIYLYRVQYGSEVRTGRISLRK